MHYAAVAGSNLSKMETRGLAESGSCFTFDAFETVRLLSKISKVKLDETRIRRLYRVCRGQDLKGLVKYIPIIVFYSNFNVRRGSCCHSHDGEQMDIRSLHSSA